MKIFLDPETQITKENNHERRMHLSNMHYKKTSICLFISGPVKSPDTGDAARLHRPFGELVNRLIKGFIPALHTLEHCCFQSVYMTLHTDFSVFSVG